MQASYLRKCRQDRQIPGLDEFVAQLCVLAGDPNALVQRGLSLSSPYDFEVRRSVAYWRQVHALLEDEGCMTPEQFDHHYRELISFQVDELCRARDRQVRKVIAAATAES